MNGSHCCIVFPGQDNGARVRKRREQRLVERLIAYLSVISGVGLVVLESYRGRGGLGLLTCGRAIQSSGPLRYAIVDGLSVRDSRVHNYPPRWKAAPSRSSIVRSSHRQNRFDGQLCQSIWSATSQSHPCIRFISDPPKSVWIRPRESDQAIAAGLAGGNSQCWISTNSACHRRDSRHSTSCTMATSVSH